MSNKNNITLIGMPFSGKTTVAKLLAEELNYQFVDLDDYIMNKFNMSLSDIVFKFGNTEFKRIEEEAILEMKGNKKIFSTGGSVIYSKIGMEHFKKISKVIFLEVSLENLKHRMSTSMEDRGIVFKPGQTFDNLFDERQPFYKKYCCKIINNNTDNIEDTVFLIKKTF